MPADVEDAQLLERWSGGDDSAGRAFVDRHFDSVYRFFRNKVDRSAEDLTQQVFAACAAAPQGYRGEGTARAYLLGVARRTLFKHFRKARREADALRKGELSVVELGGSPSSALGARTEVQLLHGAMRRLPLDLQILLELQYWEDTTMREIAEILEIPTGTVKTRLARARTLLREAIEAARAEPRLLRSTVDGIDTWIADLRDALKR